MPLDDSEVFGAKPPTARPAGGGMTDEEVFGAAPAEKKPPEGFVENFKANFRGDSLSGVWGLLKESLPANLWRAATEKYSIQQKKGIEAAMLAQARQVVANQKDWPEAEVKKAYDLLNADAARKKAEDEHGLLDDSREFVASTLENPGKSFAELANSLIRDPEQLFGPAGQIGKGATFASRVAGVAGAGAATNALIEAGAQGAEGKTDLSKLGAAGVTGAAMGLPFALAGPTPKTLRERARGRAEQAREAAKNDSILDMAERYAGARPPAEPPEFIPPKDLSKLSKKERAAYDKQRAQFEERLAADQETAATYDPEAIQAEIEGRLAQHYDDSMPPEEPRAPPPEYGQPMPPDAELPIGHLAGMEPKGRTEPLPRPEADSHTALFESARDKVIEGRAFDLTADEKVALRGHVEQVTRGGVIEPQYSRARREGGQVDPRLLAGLATAGLGAAVFGTDFLSPEEKQYLAAGMAGSVSLVGKGRPFKHVGSDVLAKMGRKAGTAEEWAAELRAAQAKVGKGAAEEMGGVMEWLRERSGEEKIPRAAVEQALRERSVEVSEVVRGAHPQRAEYDKLNAEAEQKYGPELQGIPDDEFQRLIDLESATNLGEDANPRYDSPSYRTPGGENYRETVYTVPDQREFAKNHLQVRGTGSERIVTSPRTKQNVGMIAQNADGSWGITALADVLVPLERRRFATQEEAIAAVTRGDLISDPNYRSSHWPEPNAIAHTRTQDFTTPRGERVHHIDEVQSDWGQQLRDHEEWVRLREAADEAYDKLPPGAMTEESRALHDAHVKAVGALDEFERKHPGGNYREAPPVGPFVHSTESWASFVLKREIARAVAEGKDYVTWAPGKEHSKRYGGHAPEGMEGFYGDEGGTVGGAKPAILTSIANGILKKLGGGKVESVELQAPHVTEARFGPEGHVTGIAPTHTVPGFRITPEMRAKVSEGLPLFGRQGGFADPKLLAALGLGAGGAAVGAWLAGKDGKEWGAAVGGLLGVAAALGALKKPAAAINWGLGLVSREFKEIDPRFRRVMVNFEREHLEASLKNHTASAPFVEALKKLDASVREKVWLALGEGTKAAREALLREYPNLRKPLDAVDALIKEKGDWLRTQRRFVGGPEYYFPLKVKDYKGLLNKLGWEGGNGLAARIAEHEKAMLKNAGRLPTEIERARVISDWLRETKAGMSRRAGFTHRRGVELTPELAQFYHDPADALLSFLSEAQQDIQRTKLFGRKAATRSQDGVKYLNVEGSIEKVVNEEYASGRLTEEKQTRLRELLRSRLGPGEKSMPTWHQDIQNVVSASLLGHPFNAIKQIPDYAMGMLMVGMRPMLRATVEGLTGKSRMKLHDLGLVNHVYEEFANERLSARYLNWALKWSGFSHIDTASRHVIVNAALDKFQRDARAGGHALEKKYSREFSPEEMMHLQADLTAGRLSPLVRDLVFMELSDVQPVSRLERSQAYLDHPSARFMYHLKSYTLKQLDIARREVLDNWRDGEKAEAVRKALGLAIVWGGAGAATESLVDYMLGKATKFSDKVFEQIARNLGWSDWAWTEARGKPGEKGNWPKALGVLMAPPAAGLLGNVVAEPGRAWQAFPLIGRLLYAYGMGGALEEQERELIKNGGAKDVKASREAREEAGQATYRDKVRVQRQKEKVDAQEEAARSRGDTEKADKLLERSEKLRGRLERMGGKGGAGRLPMPWDKVVNTMNDSAEPWSPPRGFFPDEREGHAGQRGPVAVDPSLRRQRLRELRKVM